MFVRRVCYGLVMSYGLEWDSMGEVDRLNQRGSHNNNSNTRCIFTYNKNVWKTKELA